MATVCSLCRKGDDQTTGEEEGAGRKWEKKRAENGIDVALRRRGPWLYPSRRRLIGSNRVEATTRGQRVVVADVLVSRLKFQLLQGVQVGGRGVKTSSNLPLIERRRRFR